MKIWKVLPVILVLAAMITALPGCKAKTTTDTIATQEAAVTRGDITKTISAAGNLALAHTEDLAVELFYPAGTKGTIGEVLVGEGDSVTKGQLLVTIDKNEWNDQLTSLESMITVKERALLQAQINVKVVELAIITANEAVTTRKSAILTAELNVMQAQSTLNAAIINIDFVPLVSALNKAKTWYEYISVTVLVQGLMKPQDWELAMVRAAEQLDAAQAAYDDALSGYNNQDVITKRKQVQIAELSLTAAKTAVIDAQNEIPLKELNLKLSQGNLEDAVKAVEDAKNNLVEAKAKNPEITAPFDGIIIKVNVAGGDEVLNGTVVLKIADPEKFEAEILVSEMDIPQVKVGGQAIVTADALPGTFLTATVKHISPTATISSGVVNYIVKVDVQPPGTNPFGAFSFGDNTTMPWASGESTFPSADNTGKTKATTPATQSTDDLQADKTIDTEIPDGFSFGQFPSAPGASEVTLREGLTVTVTITLASRTDVLMVPIGAVSTVGFSSYVQIIDALGNLEKREVKTGISDWQYTEITEGLKEGEKIQVTLNTAPSTNFGGGNMIFMGGR